MKTAHEAALEGLGHLLRQAEERKTIRANAARVIARTVQDLAIDCHGSGLGRAASRAEEDVGEVELHPGRDAALLPVLNPLGAASGLVPEELSNLRRAAERLNALRIRLNEGVGGVHARH